MPSQISERLKSIRQAAGLSVRQVARAIGVPAATYANYEYRYAKAHLPEEFVERLAPVLEDFGVPADHVRALRAPVSAEQEAAPKVTLLSPARLTRGEKAVIRHRVGQWQNQRDFTERSLVIKQLERPVRTIVEDLLRAAPRHISLDDALQEAWIATTEAIDKADYRAGDGAFFQQLEQMVRDKVQRYLVDIPGFCPGLRSGSVFFPERKGARDKALRAQIEKDEAAPPVEFGTSAIPIYSLRTDDGSASIIEFRSAIGWCRRPVGLIGRRGIYGAYAPNESLLPRVRSGDLVLLDALKGPSPQTDDGLVILKSDRNSELRVLFGHIEEINDRQTTLASFASSSTRQSFPRGTPLHRLLKLQDVV